MHRRALIGLAASCLLAACVSQTPGAMPGMAWSLQNAEGEGAKLAFGQPSSDNILLMMTCQPRSGDVRLSLAANQDAAPTIALFSRGVTGRYAGEFSPTMDGSALVEGAAKATDPALRQFAMSGDLTVLADGRRMALPVREEERGKIGRFFQSCSPA